MCDDPACEWRIRYFDAIKRYEQRDGGRLRRIHELEREVGVLKIANKTGRAEDDNEQWF